MKNFVKKFSFLISHFSFQKGFTLIEMLVVFAIMGTLTVVGVTSFFSYSQTQAFQTSVSEVAHSLETAKARAIAQVKPSNCGVQVLRAYQVSFTVPGSTYSLQVVCGANTYTLQTKNLPVNAGFSTGSATVVSFAVRSGILAQQQTISIARNSVTKTITVDTAGNISVQ